MVSMPTATGSSYPSRLTSQAAVASGHPLATAAAVSILRDGGSAIDAAIAADAMIGFIEPTSTGIGGDVMAVVMDGDEIAVLNGSGRSAMDTDPTQVEDNGYGFVPSTGGHAVTTPGAVRAWWDLHQRYGRLPWHDVLGPTIAAATNGGEVGEVGSRLWGSSQSRLDTAAESMYFPTGSAPTAGAIWRNQVLATTLSHIAANGPEAFYVGELADALVASVQSAGGCLDHTDLATHTSEWVAPLVGSLGEHQLVTAPPNCQGLVVALAAEMLHQTGDLTSPSSTATTVAMAEALDRAFSVALDYVADPDVVHVPAIDAMRIMARTARCQGPMPYGPGTVFTAVAAGDQMVALVSSVCDRFGAGVGVLDGGFVLQSRGRGFSLDAQHRNALAPHKRPYHTIVPTILLRDGSPIMSIGVVGGIMQPQGQIQILHRVLTGMGLSDAIEAPRFRLLGDGKIAVEAGFEADHAAALTAAGYQMRSSERVDYGGANVVQRTTAGLVAASDSRRDGVSDVIEL